MISFSLTTFEFEFNESRLVNVGVVKLVIDKLTHLTREGMIAHNTEEKVPGRVLRDFAGGGLLCFFSHELQLWLELSRTTPLLRGLFVTTSQSR